VGGDDSDEREQSREQFARDPGRAEGDDEMNRTLERAVLLRPLVLVIGGLSSALVQPKLQEGALLPWMLLIFVGAALCVTLASRVAGLARAASIVSPTFGMIGWGAFAVFTGGLESPFVVALIFEIVVAILSMGPRGVAWVTGNALVVMIAVEGIYGFASLGLLLVESVFVAAIGGLGGAMWRRRIAGEVALKTQGEELGERLDALQRELEDERVISRVGENVARLAHGLKNAVHSLRGFVSLIEPNLDEGVGSRAAVKGLHTAIDDLEKLARLTLSESSPAAATFSSAAGKSAQTRDVGPAACVQDVVYAAHNEVFSASPGVSWRIHPAAGGETLHVAIAKASLSELLVILMRNGVEAMEGSGSGIVEYGANGDFGLLVVTDQGPGFAKEDLERISQPGYTTKSKGSGFGLFLARRIVEDHGGALSLEAAEEGGARVRIELPRVEVDAGLSARQIPTGAAN
jgi:signal transduction histidine kinase